VAGGDCVPSPLACGFHLSTVAVVQADTIYESFGGKPGLVRAMRTRALVRVEFVGSLFGRARLVRLCFLIEREYAPYSKWLGTAFARLPCGPHLVPSMTASLRASAWREREPYLTTAFEMVAAKFNALGLTEPVEPTVRPFYNRPFLVLGSGRFVDACMAATPLRELGFLGSIDQFVDSTDALSRPDAVAQVTASLWAESNRVTARSRTSWSPAH
jgi:hypothetical protein